MKQLKTTKKLHTTPANLRTYLGLLALTMMIMASGCESASQGAPGGMPTPTVVTAVPLKKMIVVWDEYTGRLEAVNYVEIRARVSGYLESMHFDEGEFVKEGDLLFVVDPRPYQAEVTRSKASVGQSKAEQKQATANLAVATAQRNASKARYDLAKSDLDRAQTLRDRNVITAEEYDNRSASLLEAEANIQEAEAQIEAANAGLATAEANVSVAEAALAIAELNLSYTNITAPVAGRISQRYVTEGNLISGGTSESTLLTTIVSLDPIYCEFYADESEYLKYSRMSMEGKRKTSRDFRTPVYAALADEKSFIHQGHIDFVDNQLDQSTATILGRAILSNPDLFLTPGMFVRVRLPGSAQHEAILLPDQAINTDQNTKFVYIVNAESKVERRPVQLGTISHGLRVIQSGLVGTEKVVVSGVQKVRPGMTVKTDEKPTSEVIIPTDNEGLPDEFEVVPREKWLLPPDEKRKSSGSTKSSEEMTPSKEDEPVEETSPGQEAPKASAETKPSSVPAAKIATP